MQLTNNWTQEQRQTVALAINLSMWIYNMGRAGSIAISNISPEYPCLGNNETIIGILFFTEERLNSDLGLSGNMELLQKLVDCIPMRLRVVQHYIANCGQPNAPQLKDWIPLVDATTQPS